MDDLQRYELVGCDFDCCAYMEPSEDGEYVKVRDVKKLLKTKIAKLTNMAERDSQVVDNKIILNALIHGLRKLSADY